MVTKKKASFYSKKNLSAKPKSVGKSKISFDFEQQFTERKGPEPKDLEYVYKTVDKVDDENLLIEKAYTISELEYTIKPGKIIFNKK